MRAWIDIAVLTVLAVIGILGFAPSFTDQQYLWAGLGGLVVGTAAGIAASMLRLGPVLTLLIGVFAYFAFGSAFAMPEQAIAVVIPSLETLSGLAVGAVFGWADMVTLTTPVAAPDYIGVLPYVAAWAVGAHLELHRGTLVRDASALRGRVAPRAARARPPSTSPVC